MIAGAVDNKRIRWDDAVVLRSPGCQRFHVYLAVIMNTTSIYVTVRFFD